MRGSVVEHSLGKGEVAGSIPAASSISMQGASERLLKLVSDEIIDDTLLTQNHRQYRYVQKEI